MKIADEQARQRVNVRAGDLVVHTDAAQETALEAQLSDVVRRYIKYEMSLDLSYTELFELFARQACFNDERKLRLLKFINRTIIAMDYSTDHPGLLKP